MKSQQVDLQNFNARKGPDHMLRDIAVGVFDQHQSYNAGPRPY